MSQLSDEVIIDQVIDGKISSYSLLIERYQSYVYTVALNIVQLEEEAEEVAQDSFVKAYRNLAKFNRESKFTTWLYRITFNTALTAKKKLSKKLVESLSNANSAEVMDFNKTEHDDRRKYISIAMGRLSEPDAAALTLFYLEELSLDEICKVTDVTLSNLKVRLHRARKRFAIELQQLLKKEAATL